MPTFSPNLSARILSTVAITDPPTSGAPAILFRTDAPPTAHRAIIRSRFSANLSYHRTANNDLYVWRSNPVILSSDALPPAFRPYTPDEFRKIRQWCPLPVTATSAPSDTSTPSGRIAFSTTPEHQGHWFIVQPKCHASLTAYYRNKHPSHVFTYRKAAGALYGRTKADATHTLPADAPDFFQDPPLNPVHQKVAPHDMPQAGTFNAYMRKDIRVRQLYSVFPDAELWPDLANRANRADRYVRFSHAFQPTDAQAKYLACNVRFLTVRPGESLAPPALPAIHAHQAYPTTCNVVSPPSDGTVQPHPTKETCCDENDNSHRPVR